MKFVYIDESGNPNQGDVFTMAGIMIDATDLVNWTSKFTQKISGMLAHHRGERMSNLKAKQFIEGRHKWNQYVDERARMKFFKDLCTMVTQCGTVYAYGMSFKGFNKAIEEETELPRRQNLSWLAVAMFITCLIQRKMQLESGYSGETILTFDRHNLIPALSDRILNPPAWYDSLYAQIRNAGPSTGSQNRGGFDRIINRGFSTPSEYSALIQVADVLSYIYRRYLELKSGRKPNYPGEQATYEKWVSILEPKRERFGRYPKAHPQGTMTATEFYELAKHPNWEL